MLIKPRCIQPGAAVSVIAPASPPLKKEDLELVIAKLEAEGLTPRLGKHVWKRNGFLAGTDRERAADLMEAFANKRSEAVLCVRGGYGATRLLDRLDYERIGRNPKILMGYSDITALSLALLKRCRLVTFHGPMLTSDLIKPETAEYTKVRWRKALFEASPIGSLRAGYPERTIKVLRRGKASGRLIGGNLSLICALLGTRYLPSFAGAILFLEEVAEQPYAMDRALTQLHQVGALAKVKGVAVGICEHCNDPKAGSANEYRQTLEDVLRERLGSLKVPVVMGLPFGHTRYNATLPMGVRATLDGSKGDLVVEEAAVLGRSAGP